MYGLGVRKIGADWESELGGLTVRVGRIDGTKYSDK